MDFAEALTIVRKEQPTVGDVHVGAEIGHHRAEAGRKGKKRKGKKPTAAPQQPQITTAYFQHALAKHSEAKTRKGDGALTAAPMVGAGGRKLEPFDDSTMFTPLKYSPAALGQLRPDQVPGFLHAVTHPKRLPLADVPIDKMIAIQSHVSRDVVQKNLDAPEGTTKPPVVVRVNGEHYVADGHHRLAAAWLRGEDTASVRVKDIDGEPRGAMKRAEPRFEKAGVRVEVTKTDDDQRLVFGWFSVSTIDGQPVVDKQSDIIDTVDLEKAVYDYVLHHRAQGDMHGGDQKGRLVESVMFTAEKQKALGIDLGREGWFGGFRVDDGDVWKAIKRGERPEFSIGGTAIPVEA